MSRRSALRPALTACLAAAALASAIDVCLSVATGGLAPASYYLVYAGAVVVTAGAAALLAAAASRGAAAALFIWVVLTALLTAPPSLAFAAVVAAAATLGWLRHRRHAPAVMAAAIGAAGGATWVVWPTLASELPAWSGLGAAALASPAVAFGAAALGLEAHAAIQRRLAWLPSPLAIAFLACALGLPLFGVAGRLLRGFEPPSYPEAAPATASRPHVILLVLDTVRADALSLYGYERETSPQLHRLASDTERVTVYPFAYSPASWTLPAHASLFTGTIPSEHGTTMRSVYRHDRSSQSFVELEATVTLAERLRDVGYRTASIAANGTLSMDRGLRRGFDWWVHPPTRRPLRLPWGELWSRIEPAAHANTFAPYPAAARVNEMVLDFVDACRPAPCFVFANYMEAHDPYAPPAALRGTFQEAVRPRPISYRPTPDDPKELVAAYRDAYDEEILGLDAAVGELVKALRRRGVLDDAWLVVTSDHGESFGEHGVTLHGTSLYNPQTRVPLLIRPPRGQKLPPARGPVSLLDVTATLSRALAETAVGSGRDLRRGAAGPPVQLEFFGDPREFRTRFGRLAEVPARAVVEGEHKCIEYEGRLECYTLENTAETRDRVAHLDGGTVARLRGLLPPLAEAAPSQARGEEALSAKQREMLRALGYAE